MKKILPAADVGIINSHFFETGGGAHFLGFWGFFGTGFGGSWVVGEWVGVAQEVIWGPPDPSHCFARSTWRGDLGRWWLAVTFAPEIFRIYGAGGAPRPRAWTRPGRARRRGRGPARPFSLLRENTHRLTCQFTQGSGGRAAPRPF